MLAFDYYAAAFSRTILLAEIGQHSQSNASYPALALLVRFQQWKDFLNNYTLIPRSILLLDDETSQGWHDAIKGMFSGFPSVNVESYPIDRPFILSEAQTLFLSKNWDVVFCDLRLTPQDHSTLQDVEASHQLSGIEMIKFMKHERPNVPVVAFTASEKHWTYRKAIDAGADAWWTKENPQHGFDHVDSLSNVVSLTEVITDVIHHKNHSAQLWHLIDKVNNSAATSSYMANFVPPGKTRPDLISIIDSIKKRLYAAYGYLDYRPNQFRESTFFHFPLNLAFLNIWSCTNELLRIFYIEEPSQNDYSWFHHDGNTYKWTSYAQTGSQFHFFSDFLQIANGSAGLAGGPITAQKLRNGVHAKSAPFHWIPNMGLPPDYVIMLIRSGKQSSATKVQMEQSFQHCRMNIRNKLNLEHGDYQTTIHATMGDILMLISIIEKILDI